MSAALRAVARGAGAVVRAPLLLLAVMVSMIAVTAPLGVLLGAELQASLSRQQPVSAGIGEIDPEWWQEFREHAEGLAATFTPTILGAAAPLDNLSSLLDGTRRPAILIAPVVAALVLWAFLWGAILDRFVRGASRLGFWRGGARTFVPFLGISVVAGAIGIGLYLTVHPLLFGPVLGWLQSFAATEAQAFSARVVLYVAFGLCLITVALLADYARVSAVWAPRGAIDALRSSSRFLRSHWRPALVVYVLIGAGFAAIVVAYAVLEAYLGSLVGGWRGVALAQVYLVLRLSIRLLFGASAVALFSAIDGSAPASR